MPLMLLVLPAASCRIPADRPATELEGCALSPRSRCCQQALDYGAGAWLKALLGWRARGGELPMDAAR
jgi:hypothetical protein